MSKLTVQELEQQAADGKVIKEDVHIVTYRDVDHPDVIRKVCPYCHRVFDRYLLMAGGLIGCRRCAFGRFIRRCAELAKDNVPDVIEDAVENFIRSSVEERVREKIDEL